MNFESAFGGWQLYNFSHSSKADYKKFVEMSQNLAVLKKRIVGFGSSFSNVDARSLSLSHASLLVGKDEAKWCRSNSIVTCKFQCQCKTWKRGISRILWYMDCSLSGTLVQLYFVKFVLSLTVAEKGSLGRVAVLRT